MCNLLVLIINLEEAYLIVDIDNNIMINNIDNSDSISNNNINYFILHKEGAITIFCNWCILTEDIEDSVVCN